MINVLSMLMRCLMYAAIILAPSLLIGLAQANNFIINSYSVTPGQCVTEVSTTDQFGDTDADLINETMDIGAAHEDRYIALISASSGDFTSGSVGGVSLAKVNTEVTFDVLITVSPVTTGTTATVVLNLNDNGLMSVGVYRVLCPSTPHPDRSGGEVLNDATLTSNAFSVSATIPVSGGAAALARCSANTNTFTWTNATEDFDGAIEASAQTHTMAHNNSAGAVTITAQASGTCSSGMLIVASWGQALEVAMIRATCVTDTGNLTTYNAASWQSISIPGLLDSESVLIVVGVAARDGTETVFGVSSMTIEGNAATEVVDENGTGVVNTAFYRSSSTITNASTVNVSVTMTEAVTSAVACVWAIVNPVSTTPDSSVVDDDTAAGVLALTLGTTNAAGFAFGICANDNYLATTTWAVLTERQDGNMGAFLEGSFSNADGSATGSSMSVTCDATNTGDSSGAAVAFH